jgi:predicted phosphodiesterase
MKSPFWRLVIPDFHGQERDLAACAAVIEAAKIFKPKQVAILGDAVDCSGVFSNHPMGYVQEVDYSYETDITAANVFLDELQEACGDAEYRMNEGNHDQHVERWIAKTLPNKEDAKKLRGMIAPDIKLRLKQRGIKYYRLAEFYDGLSLNGTYRWGKCFFTHGISASKFATAAHVTRFAANIVHGHTHRAQSFLTRTVASGVIGGWCPGTLSKLQPMYFHGNPTEWAHGYGLALVEPDGRFLHINVPIIDGRSMASGLVRTIKPKRMYGGK